jgi:hypothetical protein
LQLLLTFFVFFRWIFSARTVFSFALVAYILSSLHLSE